MKWRIMRHFIGVCTVCKDEIHLQRKKYNLFVDIITRDPSIYIYNQRRVRNDTQTNNRQNNEDRPLYSNVVQRNRQQRGAMGRSRQPGPPRSMESRRPQGENQDFENNTTFIGQRFQQRNRSPDLPPFYRSRFRANTSPREERHDQQNTYRYRSGQNRNRQRDDHSYNRLSNQDQNHFLEQDDQITQET